MSVIVETYHNILHDGFKPHAVAAFHDFLSYSLRISMLLTIKHLFVCACMRT